jgi:hypothetical protein
MKTGLFIVSYTVGNEIPGAPLLNLDLMVNTPNKEINGAGSVTQAINPPLDVKSKISGDYSYMTVMPNSTHILLVLTGYPNIKWPKGGGIGPVIMPNLEVRLVLNDDWKSGTGNFTYTDNEGEKQEIEGVPVKLVASKQAHVN